MGDESERESSATMKAVAWIEDFMAALGDLGPDVQARLLGQSVSAGIDTDDIKFGYVYDPRTSTPALAADHFIRNVVQLRRKQNDAHPR
jgi:hypothetical protein